MVGNAPTSYVLATLPPRPSHQCAQGMSVLLVKSCSVSRSASQLTLTKTNGLLPCCLTISRVCGIIALHGPHHVAQKSSTTTLPFRSLSLTGLLSMSEHSTSGALAPIFSVPPLGPSSGSLSPSTPR